MESFEVGDIIQYHRQHPEEYVVCTVGAGPNGLPVKATEHYIWVWIIEDKRVLGWVPASWIINLTR